MASITPQNGRTAFIAAQNPHTYWELNTTNLGTNFGRDTSGNDNNTNVASGDLTTQESYEGMNNQNDPPTSGWADTCITTDAAGLFYIPAGLTHNTVRGLFHNGGGTNAQGGNLRATATGVEVICQHNNANGSVDGVVYEIPDADLPGWFAISFQFNSHGGSEGDMALWVNGTAVASGTRVFTLDYGSGNVDFGNSTMNDITTAQILDGPNGSNWAGATSINGSGVLIANFAFDNPAKVATGTPPDNSPGGGNSWHTDYYDAHVVLVSTQNHLYLGDTAVTAIKLGDTNVTKAYLGDTQVFPAS